MQKFINKIILLSYMEITRLSSKGQIVIPQKIREELKLDEGSVLAIEHLNGVAVLKKIDFNIDKQLKKSLEDLKFGRIRKIA